jgi:UDP-N-acetylmuramate dehydrogenase
LKIYKSYNLKKISTFNIGGKAEYFCMPNSISQIFEAFKFAKKNNLGIYTIGGGSNILFSDNGLKGLVISTKKLNKYQITKNIITVEAGITLKKLNKILLNYRLTGLEFTSGLPGTIGGAAFMNARAYGNEMSEIIKSVTAIKKDCQIIHLKKKDLNFSYKDSLFKKNPNLFIYNITLNLKKGILKEIKHNYKKNILDRNLKEQFKYPSVGCIFKNNYKKGIIAGRVIDELGMKGLKVGDAEIYKKHGNFIINKNNAKAEDVKKLIELIENRVYKEKKIKLEREVVLFGF